MVEDVEELGSELCGPPLFEFPVLEYREVPGAQRRLVEEIAGRSSERAGCRRYKNRTTLHIASECHQIRRVGVGKTLTRKRVLWGPVEKGNSVWIRLKVMCITEEIPSFTISDG